LLIIGNFGSTLYLGGIIVFEKIHDKLNPWNAGDWKAIEKKANKVEFLHLALGTVFTYLTLKAFTWIGCDRQTATTARQFAEWDEQIKTESEENEED
jgi:hypothetical protein